MNYEIGLNLNINRARPPAPMSTRITRENLVKWINDSGLDDATRESLLEVLNNHPGSTLKHFYDNLSVHIARIHAEQLKKKS